MALARSTPAPGTWTYDDLLALPDDGKRYEIIEGELYELPGPNAEHALTIVNLLLLLAPIVRALGGTILTAPFDVFFPGADPVQPDILVLLPAGASLRRRGVRGAPDLVIEVLSPSNRGHDLLTKRALYGRAGVREYWVVDPVARTIEILVLDRDALHAHRTMAGTEPIASLLLPAAAFPAAAAFAGLDEIEPDEA